MIEVECQEKLAVMSGVMGSMIRVVSIHTGLKSIPTYIGIYKYDITAGFRVSSIHISNEGLARDKPFSVNSKDRLLVL